MLRIDRENNPIKQLMRLTFFDTEIRLCEKSEGNKCVLNINSSVYLLALFCLSSASHLIHLKIV